MSIKKIMQKFPLALLRIKEINLLIQAYHHVAIKSTDMHVSWSIVFVTATRTYSLEVWSR